MQVIATALRRCRCRSMDLSGLAEAEREAQVRPLAREEARTPFDLARGPLLRARLLRLGARSTCCC